MNRKSFPAAPFVLLLSVGLFGAACNRSATKSSVTTISEANVVVAIVGKTAITQGDVDKLAGRELYELREKTLESLIVDKVVEEAAKAAGMSADDFMKKQTEAKVPQLSEAEARSWFEQNKARLPNGLGQKPFEELRDMLVQGLTQDKRREAAEGVIEDLKKKAGVKVLLRAPKVEVAADGPSRGPQNAKVTVVEFSDFQCPYCSRGRNVIDEVSKHYGDKVRVVFRDFPLGFHDKAQKAAEAGHCANDQGKFWQMHDWMFDHQSQLDVDALKGAARTLGLDGNKFDQCLTSGQHAEKVKRNMRDGQKVGVSGTPAFFINGVMLSGAQPFEKFKTEIDRALAD